MNSVKMNASNVGASGSLDASQSNGRLSTQPSGGQYSHTITDDNSQPLNVNWSGFASEEQLGVDKYQGHIKAAADAYVVNQEGGTACVGKSRHVRLNNPPNLPAEADILFNIFFNETLKVCVLSAVDCETIPGEKEAINVQENYWTDEEGDLPLTVVPDSWSKRGYFPG